MPKLRRNPDTKKIIRNSTTKKLVAKSADDPCCCGTTYIQAKLCEDDSDVDLWFPIDGTDTITSAAGPMTALPYYFRKEPQDCYVATGNNRNTTPGTLCVGETPATACPTCVICASCTDDTPETYEVSFDGVDNCDGCFGIHNIRIVSGTLSGPYTLTRVPGFPCQWAAFVSDGITVANYDDDCADPVATAVSVTAIVLEKVTGVGGPYFCLQAYDYPSPNPLDGNAMYFAGQVADPTCSDGPYAIDSDLAVCGDTVVPCFGTFTPSALALCSGGTATITPGDPATCICDFCEESTLCATISGFGDATDGAWTLTGTVNPDFPGNYISWEYGDGDVSLTCVIIDGKSYWELTAGGETWHAPVTGSCPSGAPFNSTSGKTATVASGACASGVCGAFDCVTDPMCITASGTTSGTYDGMWDVAWAGGAPSSCGWFTSGFGGSYQIGCIDEVDLGAGVIPYQGWAVNVPFGTFVKLRTGNTPATGGGWTVLSGAGTISVAVGPC